MKKTGMFVSWQRTRAQTADPSTSEAPGGTTPTTYSVPVDRIPTPKRNSRFHFMDRFAPTPSCWLQSFGRIVMRKDFDSEMGTGHKAYFKVYFNVGGHSA